MRCHYAGDKEDSRYANQEGDGGGKTGYSRSEPVGLQDFGQPVVEAVIDGIS